MHRNFDEEFLLNVEDLTLEKKSVRTIAKELGCDYQKVQRARQYMGIQSSAVGQEVRRKNQQAKKASQDLHAL